MSEQWAGITFGIVDTSLQRARDAYTGRFRVFDTEARALVQAEVLMLGGELKIAIEHEFAPHVRNPEANTVQVRIGVNEAEVIMDGPGVFVQYGTAAHWIEASPGKMLHWQENSSDGSSTDRFAAKVWHPGYVGDDFIGRALLRIPVEQRLNRLALWTFSEKFGYAVSRGGEEYGHF